MSTSEPDGTAEPDEVAEGAEPAETPDETPDETPAETPAEQSAPRAGTRWWRRGAVLLAAGVLVTALAVTAAVLVLTRDRGGSAAGTPSGTASGGVNAGAPAAAQAFVAGATADITAVTAYDYRSLDIALQDGLAVTTGAYRDAYRAAITGELASRARQERIVQTFRQTAAGIGTMSADLRTAKVLVFGVQSVRRGDADPEDTPISLTATMQRQGDRYLISQLESGTNAGVPGGNAQLAEAAETVRRQVLAMLTLRRSSLSADYDAALADTVNPLRASLATSLQRTRATVAKSDYDLSGRVTAVAIESAGGNRVVVLVAASGYRVNGGSGTLDSDLRLRVTAVYTGGAWRVADSQSADE